MTETTMMPSAPEESPTANRRNVLLLGGLAAVVLAGGGYFLLAGGSSSDQAASTTSFVPHHVVKAPAAGAKTVAAAKPAIVPATSTVPIGRNPFKPLYVQPVAAVAAPAATTSTSSTSSSSTTSSTTTTPANNPAYALTLLSVGGGTGNNAAFYTFSVGGTNKTVVAAQRFGQYGELVVLAYIKNSSGKIVGALIQVGDADPVGVSIGQKITVQ